MGTLDYTRAPLLRLYVLPPCPGCHSVTMRAGFGEEIYSYPSRAASPPRTRIVSASFLGCPGLAEFAACLLRYHATYLEASHQMMAGTVLSRF